MILHSLPSNLATMPNPCAGVPANPWCSAAKRKPAKHKPPKRKPAHHSHGAAPSFTG